MEESSEEIEGYLGFGPYSDYMGTQVLYDPCNTVTYESLRETMANMPVPPDNPPIYASHELWVFLKDNLPASEVKGIVPPLNGKEIRIDPLMSGKSWRNETPREKSLRLKDGKYTDGGFDVDSEVKSTIDHMTERYRRIEGESYEDYRRRTVFNYTKMPWEY